MKTITEPDERNPFEKFKRLAQQIVSVPKKEIDEKQAEYERKKKRDKRKAYK